MRQILLTASALVISTTIICTTTTTARAEAEGWYIGGGSPNASSSHVSSHQCVHKVRHTSCYCVQTSSNGYGSRVR
jgi:hypothetical protein